MNDTILMDENSERYHLNLLLKLLLNNTMLVQCYKFINCITDSYLKHGFDTTSHINLNYVISDILKTTISSNEDIQNKIKLKECRIIFNSPKTIENVFFNYPANSKKFKKSSIVSIRSLYWNITIPCKLQMITKHNKVFNCEFDFIIIPHITTKIENINHLSVGKYILKTNNMPQDNPVKTTSHYKTTYTGYCRFDIRYKQKTNDELFCLIDKNMLLLGAIRVCLVNEIGNFLFKHIFSHLISTESEEQEGILNQLRNDPISGHQSLRSPDFDIKWQHIIYQRPFSAKIHYNNINAFTSIWNNVYETYLKFNNMITINHERLDEIRKIVNYKDNYFPDDPGYDGDISDLDVRFGRIYNDMVNRDAVNRWIFDDPFKTSQPSFIDPGRLGFPHRLTPTTPQITIRPPQPRPTPTSIVLKNVIPPTHNNDK